jgi:hypothetical protein
MRQKKVPRAKPIPEWERKLLKEGLLSPSLIKILRERFSLPRTFLKPKRSTARFRPIAAIVGDAFYAYFGPIIREHARKELDPGAKLSLTRAALFQSDPWNLWDPYGGKCSSHPTFFDCPGVRIRTGDPDKAAAAIDVLFADEKVRRELLAFIKKSKRKNREREKKLLSSAEAFAGWFGAFFGDWMAHALAPIVGPGRRLADSEIFGLTAYLFRRNNVGVAGKERNLHFEVVRQEEAIRKAFIRWKKTVT